MASFSAGETALVSGLYKAVHGGGHSASHYVTVISGETFPVCEKCGQQVRFEIAISGPHLNELPCFRSPSRLSP
jgi:hypothetical protein